MASALWLMADSQLTVNSANAQSFFGGGDQCGRPPVERGRENPLEQRVNTDPAWVFATCSALAENPRARADQQGNAQYYTARAIATLREQGDQQADLDRAARLLDLAVRVPWPDADPLRDRARLQLARIYRLQIVARRGSVDPRIFAAALALLDQTLRTNGGPNNAVALDARYERAIIYQQRRDAGDAEAALRDLSIFATPLPSSSAWSATTREQRGRALLIASAQRLGDDAIETPTQSNIERALEYYERAQAAVETGGPALAGIDLPELYIDLGTATLQKAALQRGLSVDRRCQPNTTHPSADQLLERARGYFQTAISFPGHSSRAEQGSGCALLALREIEPAIRAFEAANAAGATGVNDLVDLARGYANAAMVLQAQGSGAAELFWARAEEKYQLAIGMAGTDRGLRARTNVELAQARQARGDLAGAWAVLTDALADDPNAPEALLARGRLICAYVSEDDPCRSLNTGISTPQLARADLLAAINQIPTPDAQVRGEAHYYLSWLARHANNGSEAVSNADSAASLAMSAQYRRHACLMRIRYYHLRGVGQRDERVRDDGTRYCLAGETRDPEALLLEGEYHLSRARSLPGGARDRAREEAYSVFGEGLRVLGRSDSGLNDLLQSRLELGQALVQYCMGLEGVGSSTINRIDQDGSIRRYFEAHDVWNCEERYGR